MGFLPSKGAGQYLKPKIVPKPRRKRTVGARAYDKNRWRKYSISYRKRHPFCVKCDKFADHVDHIVPLEDGGDMWNPENHQSLCISCHGKKTKKENTNK